MYKWSDDTLSSIINQLIFKIVSCLEKRNIIRLVTNPPKAQKDLPICMILGSRVHYIVISFEMTSKHIELDYINLDV